MRLTPPRMSRLLPATLVLISAPVGLCLGGCNDVLGIGEPVAGTTGSGGSSGTATTTTAPSTGSGGTSSAGGGGASSTGGSGGGTGSTTSSTGPTCADPKTQIVAVTEDAAIFDSDCNGSILHGKDTFSNIGLGRGLFRFVLPAEIVQAFVADRVIDMKLTLSRAPTCGDPAPCTVKKPGPFEARPLRNDWFEGTSQNYSGADWCRRLPGNPSTPWQSPGANGALDVLEGEPSGTNTITDMDTLFVMPLSPAMHKAWIGPGANGDQSLSVRIIRTDAVAVFVAVTREANTPTTAPQLTVEYCLPE